MLRRHRTTLPFAALLTLALSASVVRADESRPSATGKGYFMMGWTGIDLGDLNGALAAEGYPRFDEDFLSIGGAGHAAIGRLVLGGQGHALVVDDEFVRRGDRDYAVELTAGVGFFDLGWVLVARDGFTWTPMMGLGGGLYTLRISDLARPPFGEVLADPGRGSSLHCASFLVDLGMQVDYLLTLGESRGRRGGLVFGARAGWVLSPWIGNWSLEDVTIPGGPEVGFTGPYVRLMLGFGSAPAPSAQDRI